MSMDGTSGIIIGNGFAVTPGANVGTAGADGDDVRTMRIPVALSPSDLAELTAALSSYIERQSRSAAVG